MKLSEAFKLLEEGKTLTNNNEFYKLDMNGLLVYRLFSEHDNWHVYRKTTSLDMFKRCSVVNYIKEKKVQYYFAMAKWPDGSIGVLKQLVTDKETAGESSGLEIIQLVPFGDPV